MGCHENISLEYFTESSELMIVGNISKTALLYYRRNLIGRGEKEYIRELIIESKI